MDPETILELFSYNYWAFERVWACIAQLTDAQFVGFRVVHPLRTPTADEAKKYELDDQQIEEFNDYQKSQHGKM